MLTERLGVVVAIALEGVVELLPFRRRLGFEQSLRTKRAQIIFEVILHRCRVCLCLVVRAERWNVVAVVEVKRCLLLLTCVSFAGGNFNLFEAC
jgi:hypothetical protein